MKLALNNISGDSGKQHWGSSLQAGSGDRGFQDIMSLLAVNLSTALAGNSANFTVLSEKNPESVPIMGELGNAGLTDRPDLIKEPADIEDISSPENLTGLFQPGIVSIPPELNPAADKTLLNDHWEPVLQPEPQQRAEIQSRTKPVGQTPAPLNKQKNDWQPAMDKLPQAETPPENKQEIQPGSNQDKRNSILKEMWESLKNTKENQTNTEVANQAPDVLTGKFKQQVKNTMLPDITTFYKQDASPVVETGTSFETNTGQRNFNRQSMNSQEVTKESQSLTKQNFEINLSRETIGSSRPNDDVFSQSNIQQVLNGMETKLQLKVSVDNLPHLVLKEIQRVNRGNQVTSLQIKLEPEHLGDLTVKLSLKGGELSAHFIAAGGHAKEIIENSLGQLRQLLLQHNIQLSEASVYVGQESSQWAGGQSQQYSNQSNRQWRFNTGSKGLSGGCSGELKGEKSNTGQLVVNYLI